jgi:hypothetical protein
MPLLLSVVALLSLGPPAYGFQVFQSSSTSRVNVPSQNVAARRGISSSGSNLIYSQHKTLQLQSTSSPDSEGSKSTVTVAKTATKELGLLTFDLDDTLYPIAPIVEDANGTFQCSC